MNTKNKDGTVLSVSDEPAMDTAKNDTEPKYALEKLRENCRRIFGVSECTFSGATAKMESDCTIGEVKEAIKKWKQREVDTNVRRNI